MRAETSSSTSPTGIRDPNRLRPETRFSYREFHFSEKLEPIGLSKPSFFTVSTEELVPKIPLHTLFVNQNGESPEEIADPASYSLVALVMPEEAHEIFKELKSMKEIPFEQKLLPCEEYETLHFSRAFSDTDPERNRTEISTSAQLPLGLELWRIYSFLRNVLSEEGDEQNFLLYQEFFQHLTHERERLGLPPPRPVPEWIKPISEPKFRM